MSLLKRIGITLLGGATGFSINVAIQNYNYTNHYEKTKVESAVRCDNYEKAKNNFQMSLAVPSLIVAGTACYIIADRKNEY